MCVFAESLLYLSESEIMSNFISALRSFLWALFAEFSEARANLALSTIVLIWRMFSLNLLLTKYDSLESSFEIVLMALPILCMSLLFMKKG